MKINYFFKVISDDDLIYLPNLIKFDHRFLKISLFEFAVRKIMSSKNKHFAIKPL